LKTNKKLFVELTSFSVWNLFGGLADVGYKQGTNIILNLFGGVSINAVLGITNQIRNAVVSFIGNLQLAVNPQIVKSYALGDYEYFKTKSILE
jgi:O-antigen/teichoic acid export membrane protein